MLPVCNVFTLRHIGTYLQNDGIMLHSNLFSRSIGAIQQQWSPLVAKWVIAAMEPSSSNEAL